jgi:hypothetical protein
MAYVSLHPVDGGVGKTRPGLHLGFISPHSTKLALNIFTLIIARGNLRDRDFSMDLSG